MHFNKNKCTKYEMTKEVDEGEVCKYLGRQHLKFNITHREIKNSLDEKFKCSLKR